MPDANRQVLRAGAEVTGGITGVPDLVDALTATLVIQYGVRIAPELVAQFTLDTPILNRLREMVGADIVRPERSATFGVFTAADFTGGSRGSFPIGGDPPGIDFQRSLASVPKKSYGASGGIKDVDVIASTTPGAPDIYMGQRFRNDSELLLNLLLQKTLTAIDFGFVRGDATTYPTEFDGIETSMTVAAGHPFVKDMLGATFNRSMLDNLIISMQTYGVQATEIWCHPLVKQAIINAYLTDNRTQIVVQQGAPALALGNQADTLVTPAGSLRFVTSRKFTLSGTAPNLSGDIFVMVAQHDGVQILYPEYQVTPTAIDLARVPGYYTSQVYAIWSHLTLVERSNWWAQGRLKNVGFNYTYQFTNQTVTP